MNRAIFVIGALLVLFQIQATTFAAPASEELSNNDGHDSVTESVQSQQQSLWSKLKTAAEKAESLVKNAVDGIKDKFTGTTNDDVNELNADTTSVADQSEQRSNSVEEPVVDDEDTPVQEPFDAVEAIEEDDEDTPVQEPFDAVVETEENDEVASEADEPEQQNNEAINIEDNVAQGNQDKFQELRTAMKDKVVEVKDKVIAAAKSQVEAARDEAQEIREKFNAVIEKLKAEVPELVEKFQKVIKDETDEDNNEAIVKGEEIAEEKEHTVQEMRENIKNLLEIIKRKSPETYEKIIYLLKELSKKIQEKGENAAMNDMKEFIEDLMKYLIDNRQPADQENQAGNNSSEDLSSSSSESSSSESSDSDESSSNSSSSSSES